MRELATLETVLELRPIPGADAIEVAVIRGWECVVRKGLYDPGDVVVFFEIDSVLPVEPRYEFLRKAGCYTAHMDGFRIRTIKLRGQVSQGLVLPYAEVADDLTEVCDLLDPGDDLTSILGVRLYEPPVKTYTPGQPHRPGIPFPLGLPKTDEDRIQNVFGKLGDWDCWFVTEKLDGSSMTVFWTPERQGVCSRNFELSPDEPSKFWDAARAQDLLAFCEMLGHLYANFARADGLAIQGELIAPGIQGNRYARLKPEFYAFNLLFRVDGRWERENPFTALETFRDYEVQTVPNLGTLNAQAFVKDWVAASKGKSLLNPAATREGLVCRRGSESFKVINPDFLLEPEE